MNKYTELSDFEINRRIAEMDTKNRYVYFEKEQTIFRKFNNGQTQKFNPCNYPSDAMPIVFENRINLRTVDGYVDWYADHPTNSRIYSHNINPLRAAMICFLLIKDAENNNEASSSNDNVSIN